MTGKEMSAKELDEHFDNGGDITDFIDVSTVGFPNQDDEPRRVNFNMPAWLIDAIDKEAKHLAIPRQSIVIMWLAERARQEKLA